MKQIVYWQENPRKLEIQKRLEKKLNIKKEERKEGVQALEETGRELSGYTKAEVLALRQDPEFKSLAKDVDEAAANNPYAFMKLIQKLGSKENQEKTASMTNLYEQGKKIIQNNFDEGVKLLREALTIAYDIGHSETIFFINYLISSRAYKLTRFEELKLYVFELDVLEPKKERKIPIPERYPLQTYMLLGQSFFDLGYIQKSHQYYLKTLEEKLIGVQKWIRAFVVNDLILLNFLISIEQDIPNIKNRSIVNQMAARFSHIEQMCMTYAKSAAYADLENYAVHAFAVFDRLINNEEFIHLQINSRLTINQVLRCHFADLQATVADTEINSARLTTSHLTALQLSQKIKNQEQIHQAASAMVEWLSFQLASDLENPKLLSDFLTYSKIRDNALQSCQQLDKRVRKSKDMLQQDVEQTFTKLSPGETDISSSAQIMDDDQKSNIPKDNPNEAQYFWKYEYQAALQLVMRHSRNDLSEVINTIDGLITKYGAKPSFIKAVLLSLKGDTCYFSVQKYQQSLDKITKQLTAIQQLPLHGRQKAWKELESTFADIEEFISVIQNTLSVAKSNLEQSLILCNELFHSGQDLDKEEIQRINKLLEVDSWTLSDTVKYLNELNTASRGFIAEMDQKRGFLHSIGKYGHNKKSTMTADLVRSFMKHDKDFHLLAEQIIELINRNITLNKSVTLRQQQEGVWYTQCAEKHYSEKNYPAAYTFYLRAGSYYQGQNNLHELANVEHQLARIKYVEAKQMQKTDDHINLLNQAMVHAKVSVNAYQEVNKDTAKEKELTEFINEMDNMLQVLAGANEVKSLDKKLLV